MAARITAKKNNHKRLAGGLVACAAAAVLAVVGVTAFAASNVPDPTPDPDKAYTAISTPTYDEQKKALFYEQLTGDNGEPLFDDNGDAVMGYVDGKEALWTDEEKEHADIVISYKKEINRGLFLASLCSAHGLKQDGLQTQLTDVARISKLNIYLEGNDFLGDTVMVNGTQQPIYQGSGRITNQHAHVQYDNLLAPNESIDLSTIENEYKATSPIQTISVDGNISVGGMVVTTSGEHYNVRQFADDIIEALSVPDDKKPDFIVLSFDAWAWAVGSASQEKADDAQVMMRAAKLLQPYYENDAVVWLTGNDTNGAYLVPGLGSIGNYIDTNTNSTGRYHWFHYLYPRTQEEFLSTDNETTWTNPGSNTIQWIPRSGSGTGGNAGNYSNLHFGATYQQGTNFVINNDGTSLERTHFFRWEVAKGETTSHEWISGLRTYGGKGSDTNAQGITLTNAQRGDPAMLTYYTLSRKFPFYQYALLNPEKYLQYVDNDTGAMLDESAMPGGALPRDIADWNLSKTVPVAYYGNTTEVINAIRNKIVDYDYYVLEDTLAPGLVYEGISLEYLNETKNEWISFTDDDNDYVVKEPSGGNQKVKVTIKAQAGDLVKDKRVRLTIHTRCDDTFFAASDAAQGNTASNHQAAKETNIEASAHVTFNDTANNVELHRTATEFDSPVLRKTRPVVEVKGSKTWNDGNDVDKVRPDEIYVHVRAIDGTGAVITDDALPPRKMTAEDNTGNVWTNDASGEVVFGNQTEYTAADGTKVYATYEDLVNDAASGDASRVKIVHDHEADGSSHGDRVTGVKYTVDGTDEYYVNLLWGFDTWVSDVNGTRQADAKKVKAVDQIRYVVWESVDAAGNNTDVPAYIEDMPLTEADATRVDYKYGGSEKRTDYEVKQLEYNLTNTLEMKIDARKEWVGDYKNEYLTRQDVYLHIDAQLTNPDGSITTYEDVLPVQKIEVDDRDGGDQSRTTKYKWGDETKLVGETGDAEAWSALTGFGSKDQIIHQNKDSASLVKYSNYKSDGKTRITAETMLNVLPRYDEHGNEIKYIVFETSGPARGSGDIVGYNVEQPEWSSYEDKGVDSDKIHHKRAVATNTLVTTDYTLNKQWIMQPADASAFEKAFKDSITLEAKGADGSIKTVILNGVDSSQYPGDESRSAAKFAWPTNSGSGKTFTYTWKGVPAYMGDDADPATPPVQVTYAATENGGVLNSGTAPYKFNETAPGYRNADAQVAGEAQNNGTITNIQKFDIDIFKNWDDVAGNQNVDGHRPSSIKFQLYQNGKEYGSPVTVTGGTNADTWELKAAFTDVPYADAQTGAIYNYTMVELPDGLDVYQTSFNPTTIEWIEGNANDLKMKFTFDNEHDPELVTITATKVWDDDNNRYGKRTDVEFTLTPTVDGRALSFDDVKSTGTQQADALTATAATGNNHDQQMTATWDNLYAFKDGKEIKYTVVETSAPDGYTTTSSNDGAGNYTFVNTKDIETGDVTVYKKFVDENGAALVAQAIPSRFKFDLAYTTLNDEGKPVDTAEPLDFSAMTLQADGSYSYIIRGVVDSTPVHVHEANYRDATGYNYASTVIAVTGSSAQDNHADDANFVLDLTSGSAATATFTNTYERTTADITLTKVWDDESNHDGVRPANVTFTITATGKPADSGWTESDGAWTKTVKLTGTGDSWTDSTLTGLYTHDDSGNKITYTVDEAEADVPAGYAKGNVTAASTLEANAAKNFSITNSYTPKTATITVKKVWEDGGNAAGMRKPTEVYLFADGELVGGQTEASKTITDDDMPPDVTWTGLPVYKNEDGTQAKISYKVVETAISGYTTSYESSQTVELDEADGAIVTITNSYDPTFKGLTITKVWQDGNNVDGYRPSTITVDVVAEFADGSGAANVFDENSANKQTVSLTAEDDWTYTIASSDEELPAVYEGKQVVYSVDASNETFTGGDKTKYTHTCIERVSAGEYKITNIHEPETTSVTVTKVWSDNNNRDGKRPEIDDLLDKLTLKADGTDVTGVTPVVEVINNNSYKVIWENVPEKKAVGTTIVYTVTEATGLSDYYEIDGDATVNAGGTITNKQVKTDITVHKIWVDKINENGSDIVGAQRPDTITVKLTGGADDIEKTVDVTSDTSQDIKFEKVDLYDASGAAITYTVDEDPVANYDKTTLTVGGIRTLINTYKITSISGTKTWVDGGKAHNNSADITLAVSRSADGGDTWTPLTANTDYHVDWSGANDSTYTVRGLQQYAADGTEFTFKVEESPVPTDYVVSYDGYNITNTITGTVVPEGSKAWVEGDDADHDNTALGVQLWRKSANVADEQVAGAVISWDEDEGDSSFKFYADDQQAALPKYDGQGAEYTYYVKEGSVPDGYDVSGEGTMNLTNAYEGTTATVNLDEQFKKIAKDMPAGVDSETFNFILATKATAPAPTSVEGTATVTKAQSDAGDAVAITGFGSITFTEAGEYTYTLYEKGKEGWTAEPDSITLTVTVTDNNGNLTAVVTPDDVADRTITNTWQPDSVSGSYEFKKELEGRSMVAGEFSFKLEPMTGNPADTSTVAGTNDANGKVSVGAVTFTKPGTYKFTLSENEGSAPGVTYDTSTSYIVVATVSGASDGTLTIDSWKAYASSDTELETPLDADAVVFKNKYDKHEAEQALKVYKKLTGRDMAPEEFKNFKIVGPNVGTTDGTEGTATGKAAAAGDGAEGAITWDKAIKFSFDDLKNPDGSYATERTYNYTIYEQADDPAVKGVTYDATVHNVSATISVDTDGSLKVEWTPNIVSDDGKIVFANTYTPDSTSSSVTDGGTGTTGTVDITKAMNVPAGQSHNMTKDEFLFELLDADGNRVALGTNKAAGTSSAVSIAPITFTKDDIGDPIAFTIKEIAGNNDDLTYDSHELKVTATVTDKGDGTLQVAWATVSGETTFTNTMKTEMADVPARAVWAGDSYDAPGTTQIERRLDSVTVKLQKQDSTGAWVDVVDDNNQPLTVDLTKANNWAAKFANQPVYDPDSGQKIQYQVVDTTNPTGYTATSVSPSVLGTGGVVVYEYKTVKLEGTKTWVDGGKKHSNAEEITLNVVATKDGVDTPLNEGTDYHVDWDGNNYTIRGIADDGSTYTVTETLKGDAAGKYNSESEVVGTKTNFTNTIKPEDVTVKVTKKWIGDAQANVMVQLQADGTPIATHEFATGDISGGSADFTFTNTGADNEGANKLQKYDSTGKEITYTVVEPNGGTYDAVVSGSAADGFTVTNTNKETVTIYAKKVWAADEGDKTKRAAVTFQLSQTADGATKKVGNAQAATDSAAPYEALSEVKWENLPKFDAAGNAITYSVDEVSVPEGYSMEKSASVGTSQSDPIVITNTLGGSEKSITVRKVWDDGDNQDGIRPAQDKATVTLSAKSAADNEWDGKDVDGTTVNSITLDESNNGVVTVTGLPATDATGSPYTYKVEEDTVGGYDTTYKSGSLETGEVDASGVVVITNTHTPATTTVEAYKEWDDAGVEAAPEHTAVTLHLYGTDASGAVVYDAGTKDIAKDSTEAAKWTNLPKYHYSNTAMQWQVVEQAVFGYVPSVKYGYKDDNDADQWADSLDSIPSGKSWNNQMKVVNTYVGPTTQVSVSKKWEDNDNVDGKRPEHITYELYKKVGTGSEEKVAERVVAVAADGTAEYTWYDLPTTENVSQTVAEHPEQTTREATQDDVDAGLAENVGDKITVETGQTVAERTETTSPVLYLVKEKPVQHYTTVVEATAEGEFKVINTHKRETLDVKVTKVWDDGDNADGARLDHIAFTLKGDGTTKIHGGVAELKGLVLSADNSWTTTVHGLPKYKDGKEGEKVTYTVQETSTLPNGYTSSVSGNFESASGLTITNTYSPAAKTAVKVVKKWEGEDASDKTDARPAELKFHLVQIVDGSEKQMDASYDKTLAKDATTDEQTGVEWTNLPTVVDGKSTTYRVTEDAVSGYTTTVSDGESTGTADAPELTFTVTNKRLDKINITYQVPDPENPGADPDVKQSERIVKGDQEKSAPENPEKEGYRFVGWKRSYDPDGNVIYEAQWVKIPEKAVIYKDGYSPEGQDIIDSKQIREDREEQDQPTDPTREGYIFGGWKRTVDDNGDVIYEAQWIPDKRTVSYVDPISGETVIVSSAIYTTQADADKAKEDGTGKPADPSHDGYEFAGWVAEQDAAGNWIIVAKFNEIPETPKKIVSYIDPLAPDGERLLLSEATDDPNSVGAPADPTREGYTFKGWALVQDEGGNWVYTAIWEKICPDCTSECKNGGSSGGSGSSGTSTPSTGGGTLPQTGDELPLGLLAGLVLAAGAGMVASRRRA